MLGGWKRERKVRRVLRGLARQRVALVLQPGNVWVIECALEHDDDVEAQLRTCLMRGWVEVLQEDMPVGKLTATFELPSGPLFTDRNHLYRLTDSGWAALNRAHAWTLVNTLFAAAALVAGFLLAGS